MQNDIMIQTAKLYLIGIETRMPLSSDSRQSFEWRQDTTR